MNEKQYLTSVIIPIYNCEKYLSRCLDSILNQTYKNIEIILVDDGSTDSTPNICKEYICENKNIVYFRKNNAGVCSARNKGIELSKGDYLLFVDADDYISSNYIEKLVNYAIKNHSEMVKTGYTLIDKDKKSETKNNYSEQNIKKINKDYTLFLTSSYFGYVWGTLIDSRIIKNHKIMFDKNLKFAEDLLFIFECFKKCQIVSYLNDVGYYYCENVESMTKKGNMEIRIKECYDNIYVFSKFYDYIPDKELVSAKICSRLNMKLKYLIRTNLNINFRQFKKIYQDLVEVLEFKKAIKDFHVSKNKFDDKINNMFVYLLCHKRSLIYLYLIKIYYKIVKG